MNYERDERNGKFHVASLIVFSGHARSRDLRYLVFFSLARPSHVVAENVTTIVVRSSTGHNEDGETVSFTNFEGENHHASPTVRPFFYDNLEDSTRRISRASYRAHSLRDQSTGRISVFQQKTAPLSLS